jgi:putative flavoprotein involved in K+ transport
MTRATHIPAVIVGAGQAGLAMSHALTRHGIDHVVLERGRIAERWRSERWDSLRLLTPNWMSRLPGYSYSGIDPNGFMSMPEVVQFFDDYARSFDAPVLDETTVHSVRRIEHPTARYLLDTTAGRIATRHVIAATGACAVPNVPSIAGSAADRIVQISPKEYRRPGQLPDGGVLVVGASASGIQLAREIHLSGRPVTLAAGTHVRLPRRYRGLDIHDWFEMMGTLERRAVDEADLDAARRGPSLQLVGTPDGRSIDLAELARLGVRLGGRLEDLDGERATFDGRLAETVASADAAYDGLLDRIDAWASSNGLDREIGPDDRQPHLAVQDEVQRLDFGGAGVSTIVWATGYRPDYSWLDLPVVADDGSIPHDGGIVRESPGLYLMGLPVMRTRKSTFIDGVGRDATALAAHLAAAHSGARRGTVAA